MTPLSSQYILGLCKKIKKAKAEKPAVQAAVRAGRGQRASGVGLFHTNR